jgi:hypothetical protein
VVFRVRSSGLANRSPYGAIGTSRMPPPSAPRPERFRTHMWYPIAAVVPEPPSWPSKKPRYCDAFEDGSDGTRTRDLGVTAFLKPHPTQSGGALRPRESRCRLARDADELAARRNLVPNLVPDPTYDRRAIDRTADNCALTRRNARQRAIISRVSGVRVPPPASVRPRARLSRTPQSPP